MTDMQEALLEARARWLQAYLDGDVAVLEGLEEDAFTVTSDAGTQSRHEQLAGIAGAVGAGRWFPAGSRTEDLVCHVRIEGGCALIHGQGRTLLPGRALPVIAFTEVWRRAGDQWRAMHLHYSGVMRRR